MAFCYVLFDNLYFIKSKDDGKQNIKDKQNEVGSKKRGWRHNNIKDNNSSWHPLINYIPDFFFHLCYKKSHLLRAKCKENLVLFFKAGFDYNRESNTPIMQPLFKKENKVTYPGKGKGKGWPSRF